MSPKIHPRVEQAIISFLQPYELHYYYFFLQRVSFYDWSDKIPTMCATVVNMRLAICYNNDFVAELDEAELRFLVLHELFHLLHHHLDRGKHYPPSSANVAMDMIINHLIMQYYHKRPDGKIISKMPVFSAEKCQEMLKKVKSLRDITAKEEKEILALEGKATGCVLDPNYKGELAFEPLWEWLHQEHEKSKKGQDHQLSPETKTMMDNADIRDMMMDIHIKMDEVAEDIKKQLVEDSSAKARLEVTKTRGSVPGDVDDVLKLLLKPPKQNNLKLLKRSISTMKGRIKTPSWKRINRRVEGVKGKTGVSQEINAILDVSGSMWGTFDLVLRELFRDGYTINLIQADTQVQRTEKITSKNQLKNFKIKGRGGTELMPAIRHVMDSTHRLNKFGTVILTDGYCDSFDFSRSSGDWLILTTGDLCKHNGGSRIKQIKIEGAK